MTMTQPEPFSVPNDLLQTKLMQPRLHASAVPRMGLFARLNQGLDKKLTLLTAPTGFGKTTLVSLWLADQNLPAAWVTLDEGDNDPVRFWRYVVNALRQVNGEVGKSTLAVLRVTQQPSFQPLLTGLINELAQLPGRVVLVLDDLHTITAPEVLETLLFLVEHLPPNLHLILIARSEPELSLAYLRARGELNELHAADLRFTPEEAEAFLRSALPFTLPAAAAQRLVEKTEGWPAGLRLVTLAIQGAGQGADPAQHAEAVIETFNGEHRYVLEYLRKEVFEKQPEPVRSFLLQTCFFNRLCGPLCDTITGQSGSAELLEQLELNNLFVFRLGGHLGGRLGENGPLPTPGAAPGKTAWYRYQSLFAEAIRHDAIQALGEQKVCELHEKASAWYEQHGLVEEAVMTAAAARQYERAARLIEDHLSQYTYNEILTLRRWCEQLPDEIFPAHPLVAFHYAVAMLFSLDRYAPATAARIEPLLQLAEEAWRAQGNWLGVGHVLSIRGTMAWWQGDVATAFDCMHRALECLPENGSDENTLLWRGTALVGLGQETLLTGSLQEARDRLLEAQAMCGAVHNIHGVLAAIQILGEVDYLQGEMERAAAAYQQVLAEAVGGDEMLDDQALAWLGLARIAYERGDLRTAEEQAQHARELALRRSNEAVWAPAEVLLGWVEHARGETTQALARLPTLLTRIRQPHVLREVWHALARLALAAGDASTARSWHALMADQAQSLFSAQREQQDLLASRLHIAEGRPEEALPLLRACRATAQQQGRLRNEIEALLIEAQAQQALGSSAQAVQLLIDALSKAQPGGHRRIFLDEGEPLAPLLQAAALNLPKRSLGYYATALLHAFPTRLPDQRPDPAARDFSGAVLVEPLSAQERRVLRLIASGRSNPEIAEELVVSVNTIKTQVQSIYRKLNVNSREEAREAARALDLI